MRLYTRQSAHFRAASLALAASLFGAGPSLAQLQTYQGLLSEGGQPANGTYDIRFDVYTDQVAGTTVGIGNVFNDQVVSNGLITSTFNAGVGVFNGEERWMQISVRPGTSTGAFTPLPRQRIAATPYAMRSLNERWTPNGSVLRTDLGINTVRINTDVSPVSDSGLSVRGNSTTFSGVYADVESATGSSYFGWATGGTSRAEMIYNGTANTLRLSMGGGTPVSINATGLVGLGAAPSGTERLQVSGDARATGTVSASDLAYTAPQTKTLSIPASAFVLNDNTNITNLRYLNDRVTFVGAVTSASLIAPVSLPDGAIVTQITAIVFDNGPGDFDIDFNRGTYTVSGVTALGTTTTTGTSASLRTITGGVAVSPIDSSVAQYNVIVNNTDWDASLNYLKAVRLTYTVTKPD
ncbi:hypothetical protein LBMAG48_13850 [Phycisphaerae bacterium]|nr:hypothetical protein LBMAG48_13850 [Phycisphaerae bacterium]